MQRICPPALYALLVGLALVGGVTTSAVARNPVGLPSPIVVQACDWNRPGVNPFMGDVVAAVDRYEDIPLDVRERLKARMVKRAYDDVVTIRRDSIQGKARYGTSIRDMHFGTHQVCRSVTRSAWSAQMQERGLVYCEGGDCILVPTVCRNVSRIARAQVAPEHAEGDVPALDVVPAPPGGSPQLGLESNVPSGVPMLDAPALAADVGGAGWSLAAGTPSGGGGFSATSGGFPGAALGESPVARALSAGSETQLSAAIAPVPEPETWCLLLIGLSALGVVSRRR